MELQSLDGLQRPTGRDNWAPAAQADTQSSENQATRDRRKRGKAANRRFWGTDRAGESKNAAVETGSVSTACMAAREMFGHEPSPGQSRARLWGSGARFPLRCSWSRTERSPFDFAEINTRGIHRSLPGDASLGPGSGQPRPDVGRGRLWNPREMSDEPTIDAALLLFMTGGGKAIGKRQIIRTSGATAISPGHYAQDKDELPRWAMRLSPRASLSAPGSSQSTPRRIPRSGPGCLRGHGFALLR